MKYYFLCGSSDPSKTPGFIGTFKSESLDAAIREFVILNPTIHPPTIRWKKITRGEYDEINRIMNKEVGLPIYSNVFPTKDSK